ncbi:hypothetical protein, partial [Steroidobacter sp.]|uniref:hypothetical protein n=1 Tax=Steroidobacter sp. TaxID=1978227 RepID=UPI001A60BDB8
MRSPFMNSAGARNLVGVLLSLLLAACSKPASDPAAGAAAKRDDQTSQSPIKFRMTIDDGAMIPRLAESLGYLREQGLELEEIDIHGLTPNDFEMQQPL